jgi:hypothetical protein
MYVKIMTSKLGDTNYRAPYEIYETPYCRFETRPWNTDTDSDIVAVKTMAHYACMEVGGKQVEHLVPGNVYLLNEAGKTVDTWAPNS